MPLRKLRVALIGTGFMGRAHSNAYAQVGHFFETPFEVEQTVICARDRARVEKMAATWGWKEAATDWRALIDRKDIDLIDVATPNFLHAEMAIAAAEAGKMVACEKPLAMSVEEAARMVSAARGVPTLVWFNYRRVPAVTFARQLIDEDRIGRVFHYRATYQQQSGNDPTRPPSWKTSRADAGSGAIGDLLSHVVDMALYLNGPIREITAHAETFTPGRDVDKEFLYYLLRAFTARVEQRAHGFKDSLVHLRKSELTELAVRVPPLSVQQELVVRLRTVDGRLKAERAYVAAVARLSSSVVRPGSCPHRYITDSVLPVPGGPYSSSPRFR